MNWQECFFFGHKLYKYRYHRHSTHTICIYSLCLYIVFVCIYTELYGHIVFLLLFTKIKVPQNEYQTREENTTRWSTLPSVPVKLDISGNSPWHCSQADLCIKGIRRQFFLIWRNSWLGGFLDVLFVGCLMNIFWGGRFTV